MLDIIIKNGKLIDGSKIEIAIKDKKIVEVGNQLNDQSKKIVDLKNKYFVSPGWIDDHVHCYEKMNLYYDYPDEVGVKNGVTSVIDAGTTGAENIRDFYEIAKKAKTNVFALINISKWGIVEQDELADLSKIKVELVSKALKDLPNFIVGLKARLSNTVVGQNGIIPLVMAKEIQENNKNIPLMIHIGSAPPELNEIFEKLKKGDIITHCFNGKENGILNIDTDKIKPFVHDAYEKGIIFDVGHGTASFDFHVAEVALKEGIKANSISTDIYSRNRIDGPVYNFATTMEKMHVVGYSWEEIINKCTSAPAKIFNLNGKGFLKKDYDADITVFNIVDKEKILVDSKGAERTSTETILPFLTIVGGEIYENNI